MAHLGLHQHKQGTSKVGDMSRHDFPAYCKKGGRFKGGQRHSYVIYAIGRFAYDDDDNVMVYTDIEVDAYSAEDCEIVVDVKKNMNEYNA